MTTHLGQLIQKLSELEQKYGGDIPVGFNDSNIDDVKNLRIDCVEPWRVDFQDGTGLHEENWKENYPGSPFNPNYIVFSFDF